MSDSRWDGAVKVRENKETFIEAFEPNPTPGDRRNAAIGVHGVRRDGQWKFWLNGDADPLSYGDQPFTVEGLRRIHALIGRVLTQVESQ